LTNIADDLSVITQRLGKVNWDDVAKISTNVQKVVDLFAGVDWNSISNVSRDVGFITNALGRCSGRMFWTSWPTSMK